MPTPRSLLQVPRLRRRFALIALLLLFLSAFSSPASPLAPRLATAAPVSGQPDLLIPTSGATPGGVWHYTAASGWTLHSAGLPAGWYWRGVAASPTDPDRWLLWGDTGGIRSSDGHLIAQGTTTPILWQTTDAGLTWTPITLNTPPLAAGISESQASGQQFSAQFLSDGVTVAVLGNVNGLGNFFGIPTNGLCFWKGTGTTLDGAEVYGDYRVGLPAGNITAGPDGDAIISGAFAGRVGTPSNWEVRYYPGGSTTNINPGPDYGELLIHDIIPGSPRAMVGVAVDATFARMDYHLYTTPDYRTTAFSDHPELGGVGSSIGATQDAIYIGGRGDGILKVTDALGTPTTSVVYGSGVGIAYLRVDRQTHTAVAAWRMDRTGIAVLPSAGADWQTLSLPPGVPQADLTDRLEIIAAQGPAPIKVEITDAQGKVVRALKTNDAKWPVLDADTSAIANPLMVKVTVTKPSDMWSNLAITLGSPDGIARFYTGFDPMPAGCAMQSASPNARNGRIFSYRKYDLSCDLRLLAPGATQSFSWRIWIQPSNTSVLGVFAEGLHDLTDILGQAQAEVQIPQANIRPVVFVPGFLGSLPDHHGGTEVVVDPVAGTYNGLITELQVLGYELDSSLILAPYKWYGEIRGTQEADKNDMPAVAGKLKKQITEWWLHHNAPSYVRQDRFDVVTHSTGGPVVRYYATELGDNDKLNTVIFVAAPQQGSTKAYSVWEGIDPPNSPGIPGYVLDRVLVNMITALAKKAGCYHSYGILKSYQWVTNEDLYRYVQGQDCVTYSRWLGIDTPSNPISQPGIPLLHDLLPSAGAQEQFPYLHRDGSALHSFGPTSPALNNINSVSDVNRFIDAITDNDGALYSVYSIDKRTDITKTVKWYDIETDPQVAPLWMGGQAKPVGWPGRFRKKDSSDQKPILRTNQTGYIMAQGDDPPEVWGDGTVSVYSGDLKQLVNDPRIHSIEMDEGVGHSEFFNAEEPLRQIVAPLLDPKKPESVQSILPYVQPDLPNVGEQLRRAIWWNECPVTMLITDPQGRRIGTTPDGQEVNEIPGGYYSGHSADNEPDVISFPNPASGVYTVTVTGVATDTFHIQGEMLSSTATTRLGSFSGNLQPGQVMTYTTAPFVSDASPRLLLVDDHAGPAVTAIYRDSLAQLGRTPDIWDVAEKGLPDLDALYPYDTTIWATGSAGTLNVTSSLTLEAYTYNGGAVLLSGQNADDEIRNSAILSETLHARVTAPTVDGRTVQGQSLLAGLTLHLNGGDGANNQDAPSAITALSDAVPLATYADGTGAGQAAGLAYTTRDGAMVYLSFGIEGLQTAKERVTVLDRLIRWLETGATPEVPTVSAGGPYSVTEGGSVVVTASGSDPAGGTLSFAWDLDGDGSFETPGQSASFSAAGINGPSHQSIAVQATSSSGQTATAQATIDVQNVAPTATLAYSDTVSEGSPVVLSLHDPHDPAAADLSAGLHYAFACDDGTLDSATYDTSDAVASHSCTFDDGPSTHTARARVIDRDGGFSEYIAAITVRNANPTATFAVPATVNEGDAFTIALTNSTDLSHADTAAGFTYAFDCGNGYSPTGNGSTVTCRAVDNPGSTVKGKITDKDGGVTEYVATVNVINRPPVIEAISAPVDPVQVTTIISASATFRDAGVRDTHTAMWTWGDGSSSPGAVSEINGVGSVTGSHMYSAAGVYTVKLTVTDNDGAADQAMIQYVVVYDPSAGFVTGGGWITSPAGAYALNPALTGKASFGFNAKYAKGATTPSGQTEFNFRLANLDFHSTSYQWLVVSGAKAQYKGSGTINGSGDYGFLLTAIDGQITGGGGADKFRMKIWDKASGAIVYDNQMGAADDTSPATALSGGNITIQSR